MSMNEIKRYQIFVSSTFTDLEEERGKVMETILKFECFPAGMELFPAMGEEQFKYIKRIIDDSDYYLLIIGGRYGSEDSNGVSWTEKEYDYAIEKGIPVMVFDHKDFTQLPARRTDQDDKKRDKLLKFKKKVSKGKLIRFWTNATDLALNVATSLRIVLDLQPRIGWVRADKAISGDAQKEIKRLQKEIEKYQNEIKRLEAKAQAEKGQLAITTDDAQSIINEKDAEVEKRKQEEVEEREKKIKQAQEEYTDLMADLIPDLINKKEKLEIHIFYVKKMAHKAGWDEDDVSSALSEFLSMYNDFMNEHSKEKSFSYGEKKLLKYQAALAHIDESILSNIL